jgi:phosphoglycolate phosphatase-like HAD superfamily hydrolase
MLAHDRLQPDATSKLDSWRARGITVVLATQRRNEASLREQLSKLRLLNLFDRVVVGATANKAAAVQRIMPSLNPETCVWIGDTEVDVEAARKIGCPAWVVTCGLRSETFLSALSPDRVYPDLASVEL